jgi:hypothetical protein
MPQYSVVYSVSRTPAGWWWEVRINGTPALQGIAETGAKARAAALMACIEIRDAAAPSSSRSGDNSTGNSPLC